VRQRYQAGSFNPKKPKSLALLKQCLEEAQTQQHITGGICLVYSTNHACFLDFDLETKQWLFYDPNYEENQAKRLNDVDLLMKEMSSCLSDMVIGFDLIHLIPVEEKPFFKSFNQCLADEKEIQWLAEGDGFCNMARLAPKSMLSTLVYPSIRDRLDQKDSQGETVLMIAAGYVGYFEMVELLLEHGSDPLLKSNQGKTVLHYAIEYERSQIVELILKKTPGLVNQKSIAGLTVLHDAVEKGNVNMVKKLLEHKADPNIKDDKERTALHCAIESKRPQIIELILKQATPELVNQKRAGGLTALQDAIKNGDLDVVKKLLEHKADLNLTENQGRVALDWIIASKNFPMLELILEWASPESVNQKNIAGLTILHQAVEKDDVDVVKKLLAHKANPGQTDDQEQTILHYAIELKNPQIIELILAKSPPELINQKRARGLTALHEAVEKGDVDIVKKLLGYKADPNINNDKEMSALHCAVMSDSLQILELILAGATPELLSQKRAGGLTALHDAIKKGDVDVVKKLLEYKADPNVKDDKEKTALHYAIDSRKFQIIELILARATPELLNRKRSGGLTVLHDAVEKSDLHVVKNLLERQADPKIQDNKGKTVLHCAIESRNPEIIKLILEHTPQLVNQKRVGGMTALHDAVEEGDVDVVKKLLEYKANPNIKDNKERTALHYAMESGSSQIIKLIAEKVTPELDNEKKAGLTALHDAVEKVDLDGIKNLLADKADLNITDDKERTALHCAIISGNPQILELILEKALPEWVNQKRAGGLTALHDAVKKGDVDVVKKLLEHKADPGQADDQGETVLDYAIELRELQIIELILAKATPELVNQKKSHGFTVLHDAVENGDLDVVKKLLDYKADPEIKNKKGNTALHFAVMSEDPKILELILEISTARLLNQKRVGSSTALHDAVEKGDVDVVKKLLEHKADPNIKNNKERTALHLAISLKNRKIIKLFGKNLEAAEGESAYHGRENEIIRKIMGIYSNSCSSPYFELRQSHIAAVKELLKFEGDFTIELFLEKLLEKIRIEQIKPEDSFMKCIINLCQLFPEAPKVDLQGSSLLIIKA